MRRISFILLLITVVSNICAMSYEEAQDRAFFLTDKMAYELNLNEQQYEDVYEINLDYLLNIRTANDVGGIYWETRNADLAYILYDWQYELFRAASYFIMPIVWRKTGWHFPIFSIYRPGTFFFSAPGRYYSYRGGHFLVHGHGRSYYEGRRPTWNGGLRTKVKSGTGVGFSHSIGRANRTGGASNRGFNFQPTTRITGGKGQLKRGERQGHSVLKNTPSPKINMEVRNSGGRITSSSRSTIRGGKQSTQNGSLQNNGGNRQRHQ